MGKNIARSFYELHIFVFFLYSSNVLSAPSATTTIIDEMKHDKELCNVPVYLYENKITTECNTVPYPEGDLPTDLKHTKSVLCLALYDTWYKQCQSNSVKVSFKDATTFESYIRKFLPGVKEVEQTSFCENIKSIKFSYEKLIPLLSHVNFNNSHVCYTMCLDMTGEFIPQCGILARSKSIDDETKEINKNQNMGFHTDPVSSKLIKDMNQHKLEDSNSKLLLAKTSKEITQGTVNSDVKNIKSSTTSTVKVAENTAPNNKSINDINNQGKPITKAKTADGQFQVDMNNNNVKSKSGNGQVQTNTGNDNEVKTGNSQQQIDISNDNAKGNTAHSKTQTNMNSNNAEGNSANSKMQTNMNGNDAKDNTANIKTQTNTNSNDAKDKSGNTELQTNVNIDNINDQGMDADVQTGANKAIPPGHGTIPNKKESPETLQKVPSEKDELEDPKNVENTNEDIKISIPSQNTQDHENSANEYENPMEDEKFANDPNEGADQPIDTAEQAQSVPEPSEQRDITSRYHSIRTDEESHFFTYFTIVSLISIAAYIGYHNKQKLLAIVLEGRRSRTSRGRRRPSTANYRKLDCTLEEAVTSQCNANVTHVIY